MARTENKSKREYERRETELQSSSLYYHIKDSIIDGMLPNTFALQHKDETTLMWRDGALDGNMIYHLGWDPLNEQELSMISRGINAASSGRSEEADIIFAELTSHRRMAELLDDFTNYIWTNQDSLNSDALHEYANHLMIDSKNTEMVKIGIAFFEGIIASDKEKEIIKILALSDEFTSFAVFAALKWDNGQMEILNMAKKVKGWGRIHAISRLAPQNSEISDWILQEGVDNDVMPAYSALNCFYKAGVAELINTEQLTEDQVHGILRIVLALLDEGPVYNISTLDSPVEFIYQVLNCVIRNLPLKDVSDYQIIFIIFDWLKDNGEPEEYFDGYGMEIFNNNVVRKQLDEAAQRKTES